MHVPDPIRTAVVLRHTLPGGSWHYDWLLDLPEAGLGDDPMRVATFRLPVDPLTLASGEHAEAERLPDHRRHYLTYEGPVSGGRGVVRRTSSAQLTDAVCGPSRIRLGFRIGDHPAWLRLDRFAGEGVGSRWRVAAAAGPSSVDRQGESGR